MSIVKFMMFRNSEIMYKYSVVNMQRQILNGFGTCEPGVIIIK